MQHKSDIVPKDLLMHFSKLLLLPPLSQTPGAQCQFTHGHKVFLFFYSSFVESILWEPGDNPQKAGSPVNKTLHHLYISAKKEITVHWLQVTQGSFTSITPFTG